MMQPFKLQVSLMRLFGCVKAAFADAFSVHHNLNKPFVLVPAHTEKAGFVGFCWLTHVLQIAKPRDFTKVFKPIVLLVAIFMVNVMQRRLSGHVKPRKPMCQSFLVVDGNCPIAGIGWAARTFADQIRSVMVSFPHKLACVGVIVQDGSNMVSGNHDIQFTIGQTK